eukprot:TRINITY_DN8565_c0_g1_i1.p1 TRINITY_DN8565_c0_g1~~TRINITY_DN8565_c0_g1_i1.p1  ORF type:complete len:215 (-),score=30.90 TRINITY_DN8565_c0_g1_i1:3-647(-)
MYLGCADGAETNLPESGAPDATMEKQWNTSDRLYRVNPGMELFRIQGQYTQEKLASNFTYILECANEVYVWCGKKVPHARSADSIKKAISVFKKTERPKWAILKKQYEGAESVIFQEKFWGTWNDAAASPKSSPSGTSPKPALTHRSSLITSTKPVFTLAQLINGDFPASVDTSVKEEYLSDEEFHKVFHMPKDEFARLPAWKKNSLRKKAKLF